MAVMECDTESKQADVDAVFEVGQNYGEMYERIDAGLATARAVNLYTYRRLLQLLAKLPREFTVTQMDEPGWWYFDIKAGPAVHADR